MGYIYKITNIINNKEYIGYTSRTPKIRYDEHWRNRFNDNSYLHRAMKKYGKECFIVKEIDIVNESNWEEKEQYYIKKYNTLVPNGYNICIGGEKPPVHYGEANIKSKITDDQIKELIKDLKEYKLDFGEIASKYGISQSQVERINKGENRYYENEDYPIRKLKKDQYIIKCIIEDLKEDKLSQSEIEIKYSIKSRTRLYNINIGKVGRKLFPQEKYPIRDNIINRKPEYLKNL